MNYQTFLESKQRINQPYGFDADKLNDDLFQWQARIVRWSLSRGRCALLEDCGLGKTIQQLVWAEQVVNHTGGKVMIHVPLGVRLQTQREARRFGIDCPVTICDQQEDVEDGISIVNYEKLHKFDPRQFAGVVLDESSILKSFTGATKRELCKAYSSTRYRLACTATAAPNDHMELGNHSAFLGVMPSNEMLSRWFINDTMKAGGYRLKRHGQADFWRWVASWAVCIEKPSDIGYPDDGFLLPKLNVIEHVVDYDHKPENGFLFHPGNGINATSIHHEKRSSIAERSKKVADIVTNQPDETWLVWCDTNYESDALIKTVPELIDIRGSEPTKAKEEKIDAFSQGEIKRFCSKPSLSGFGMNWQHCHNVVFAGMSFSYEQYYQAVRRTWRFGQTKAVNVHVVTTPSESAARKAVKRKEIQHEQMKHGMAEAMREATLEQLGEDIVRESYQPEIAMEVPTWIRCNA